MKFVIFHGSFGSAEGNWFPELKARLEDLGQEVLIPQFPVDSWNEVTNAKVTGYTFKQSLESWDKEFERTVLPFIEDSKEVVFVGHSLGAVYILHTIEKYKLTIDSAIFVSAFLDKLGKDWQIDAVNESFYKTNFDFDDLKKRIPTSYVLYSDNDPYVEKQHAQLFAKALESSMIFVKRAGHMNSEVNVNEFPLVFELCSTRLDLPLYQRYLKHRTQYDAIRKTRKKDIKSISLSYEEALDEGLFHFRYLKKSGFATFLTSFEVWDTEDRYFSDARSAAQKVKDFKRVFIIESLKDFERPKLRELIQKDIDAGIEAYLCNIDTIRFDIPYLDFGIWDEEYVCIVMYGEDRKTVTEVEMNSKDEVMAKASEWKKIILSKSQKIKNAYTDIDKFLKGN